MRPGAESQAPGTPQIVQARHAAHRKALWRLAFAAMGFDAATQHRRRRHAAMPAACESSFARDVRNACRPRVEPATASRPSWRLNALRALFDKPTTGDRHGTCPRPWTHAQIGRAHV